MNTQAHQNRGATASSPRGAHIIDAAKGPLVGAGRVRRTLPFASTATLGLLIAVPWTTWARPWLAAAGCVTLAATIIGAIALPWHRLARRAQLVAPCAALISTLMLTSASGSGMGSPFVSMSVLPLMWLAIYEDRAAVLAAALVAGISLLLTGSDGESPGMASIVVFTVCCIGMGVTLHGLVADSRLAALTLRDQQTALEQNATALDALPDLVNRYRVDDHVITYHNAAWGAQYNVPPGGAVGRTLDEFLSGDELAGLHSQLRQLGPDTPTLIDHVARSSGGPADQWLEWMDRYVIGDNGPEVLSIGRDVTRRRRIEQDLADSEARFRDLADKSVDVVWRFSVDPVPHFDYMSPSVERILGYPASYFLEDFTRIMELLDESGTTAIARALNGEQVLDRFDFRFRHANGSTVVGETRTAPVRGGLQGVSRDVTELRRLQDSMAALALRDPLTGLANRRLFDELLDAALARTRRDKAPLAIAFLDLDGFKAVNDEHGHDAGDTVLRETARRLTAIVRGADSVARLGGDEFAIVYAPGDAHSSNLATRIDRALAEPIEISASATVCPASIGIATTDTVGYDAAALLAAADEAMYETKRARQTSLA